MLYSTQHFYAGFKEYSDKEYYSNATFIKTGKGDNGHLLISNIE